MSRLFAATYGGRCDANGCRIEPGDQIGYAEGYDRPLCQHCWKDDLDEQGPLATCPQCWTIHAGECL